MKNGRLWAGIIGVACGYVSAHSFFATSWLALIFWGIVGLAIGYFATDNRSAKWAGGFYGFFLTLSFLLFGFNGASDKLLGFILFSLALSILGIICGIVLGYLGQWVKKLNKKS